MPMYIHDINQYHISDIEDELIVIASEIAIEEMNSVLKHFPWMFLLYLSRWHFNHRRKQRSHQL